MNREEILEIVRSGKVGSISCEEAAIRICLLFDVVRRNEQFVCDCDRQPLRYNELGTCKYCGKQKPSEG